MAGVSAGGADVPQLSRVAQPGPRDNSVTCMSAGGADVPQLPRVAQPAPRIIRSFSSLVHRLAGLTALRSAAAQPASIEH